MTLAELRRRAVAQTFVPPQTLQGAIERLGYVQADPIRAPARAQDLILFQRVAGYRIDDLERQYEALEVFEDTIYNYGFFPRPVRGLLHPRALSPRWSTFVASHRSLRAHVLAHLKQSGAVHPRELESALAAGRRVNGWGGTSSATTMMLEALHKDGRVGVVRRDNGIRIYGLMRPSVPALSPNARADGLLRLLVNLYAPMPESTLLAMARTLQRFRPADFTARYRLLVARGVLRTVALERVHYVMPADAADNGPDEARVRLLTPFDPLVWDRKRFEQLWGWRYRFEAYTPPAKRQLGYYALPMLWRDDVVGWANASVVSRRLRLSIGMAKPLPRGDKAAFRGALDCEAARFATFLGTRLGSIACA